MPGPAAPPPAPPPLVAPAGFRLAVPSEVVKGPALVGRSLLFHWPTDCWVRGTVARRSRAAGHSHVVRYDRRPAVGAGRCCGSVIRSSKPLRTGGGRWSLPCALALAPRYSRPTVTAGRRAGPESGGRAILLGRDGFTCDGAIMISRRYNM